LQNSARTVSGLLAAISRIRGHHTLATRTHKTTFTYAVDKYVAITLELKQRKLAPARLPMACGFAVTQFNSVSLREKDA
jgi:hypothetical protein